ncbi:MAG: HD domain-containing protein [Clostridia bacterium]|nr:HD domain-containing protein [Clostridia bacterium]
MKLTKGSKEVIKKLNNANFKGYVVGGTCRDHILNRPVTDVDVTTNATPDQILEVFKEYKIYETGLKHGTVTVNVDGEMIEITTFRKDGDYLNNRRPVVVEFVDDLKEDLLRRDFTINAICYNEEEGFIDLFGGLEDCKNKIIRAVGNADDRFCEDALRILRALRFCSTLSFKIEEKTSKAIIKNRHLLNNISKERIYVELTKILLGDNVEQVLLEYKQVFFTLFPSLEKCDGFDQKSKFHAYDVFTHIVKSVALAEKDKNVRLALLFHDIEKPSCFSIDDNGVGHFYGQQEKSANLAREILNDLKIDNETKKQVCFLIRYHDYMIEPTKKAIKVWLYKHGIDNVKKLLKVKIADALAHSQDHIIKRLDQAKDCLKLIDEIIKNKECFSLKTLKIDGNDLLKKGYKGEQIKEKLISVLFDVINEKVENKKEVLLKLL